MQIPIWFRYVLLLMLVCGATPYLWGQSVPLRLKVATRYHVQGYELDPNTGERATNYLGTPTVSLMWPAARGENLHVATLEMPFVVHMNSFLELDLGLSYQYNWMLAPGWKRVKPFLGMGVSARYEQSATIFRQNTRLGRLREGVLALRLVPGVRYDLNDRFFLNLEVPLDVFGLRSSQLWRVGQATSSLTPEVPLLNSIPIEIGVGVRF